MSQVNATNIRGWVMIGFEQRPSGNTSGNHSKTECNPRDNFTAGYSRVWVNLSQLRILCFWGPPGWRWWRIDGLR
ncbi:hypothetical protein ACFL6C_05515 [Myxococcota bacterium]